MRLFYAIELDFFSRDRIKHAVQELRYHTTAGRWSYPDNYHLTVQFLGEYDADALPEFERILRSAANVPAFTLELHGWGSFGQRNEIIWLGADLEPSLVLLAQNLASRLREKKMSFDDRPFKPHLTIGRQVRMKDEAGADLAALWHGPTIKAEIRMVSLMESTRVNDRLVYRSLARESLRGLSTQTADAEPS